MKENWNLIFAKAELEIEVIDAVSVHLEKYRLAKQAGETSPKIEAAMEVLAKMEEGRNISKRVLDARGFIELMSAKRTH